MRISRFSAPLLILCVLCASAVDSFAAPRNVVFILTDDQRFDSLGCLGHPYLETPNLDALVKGGILFENAFVTLALCSPSRASILSGQYPHKHGVLDNVTKMPEGTPIFPIELQKGGYETALIGKWHMGGDSDEPRPGFDRWVSFRGQGVYMNPTFNIDGAKTPRQGYVTDLITDYAVEFLRKPREKPFFLYVAHKAVHAEFRPADRHKGSYKEKENARPASMADTDENYQGKPAWVRAQRSSWHGVDGMYNDTVTYDDFVHDYNETMRAVDDSVGRIVEELRAQKLLDSTLIIFTSDNGFQFGEHGLIDKRTMYEASIRVPLVAHCPELIGERAGSRRKEMILNLDYAPTILEAAGAPIPGTVQGKSFLPMLRGEGAEWRTEFLYEYFWERSFPQTPTVLGVRTDRHKLMQYHGIWDRYELYDLESDPGEMNNLVAQAMVRHEAGTLDGLIMAKSPEETKKIFRELKQRLARLLKETGCAPEPNWRGED